MRQSKSQKFRLGLFVVISTFLLIITLYFVGNKQNIFGKTFKISAVFNNVNGLMLGNNVRYSGINVGTVKKIEMINDTTICVDMIIEDKILPHLKKNAIAAISSDGLVGSMVINIVPNKETEAQLQPGDTIKSFSKISTDNILSSLNTTGDNAALLTADLLETVKTINSGKGTLGKLISDEGMAIDLKETITALKNASFEASNVIKNMNKIISSVNYDNSLAAVFLSDSLAATKMKTIINNLEKSSIGIDSVISNIDEVTAQFKNGKGALNYILNDTILVKNIDSTMINIKKGSVKLNEDLEALKHNFLFRRYFRKLEKEQKKNNN